jgi:hypothetical protein
MESKDFFGAPNPDDEPRPSILSVVVDQCVSDFSQCYRKNGTWWEVTHDGMLQATLSSGEVRQDIRDWVRELEGDNPVGDKIVSLVRNNPGWEIIIARRVMRELERWASAS